MEQWQKETIAAAKKFTSGASRNVNQNWYKLFEASDMTPERACTTFTGGQHAFAQAMVEGWESVNTFLAATEIFAKCYLMLREEIRKRAS